MFCFTHQTQKRQTAAAVDVALFHRAADTLHTMECILFKSYYDRLLYQKKVKTVCTQNVVDITRLESFAGHDMSDVVSLRVGRLVREGVQPFVFPENPYGSIDSLLRTQLEAVVDASKRVSQGHYDDVYQFKYVTVRDDAVLDVKTSDTTGIDVSDRRMAYTSAILESAVAFFVKLLRQSSIDMVETVNRIHHRLSSSNSELDDMGVPEIMDKTLVRSSVSTRVACMNKVLAK